MSNENREELYNDKTGLETFPFEDEYTARKKAKKAADKLGIKYAEIGGRGFGYEGDLLGSDRRLVQEGNEIVAKTGDAKTILEKLEK